MVLVLVVVVDARAGSFLVGVGVVEADAHASFGVGVDGWLEAIGMADSWAEVKSGAARSWVWTLLL
jgi:hypothetical protein